MAITGQGLKSGLYIYIFRQGFAFTQRARRIGLCRWLGSCSHVLPHCLAKCSGDDPHGDCFEFFWNWNDRYFVNLFGVGQQNLMVRFTATTGHGPKSQHDGANVKRNRDNFSLLIKNPLYQQAVADGMSLLVMLPLIIGYLIIQNRFVQSAERSGIVG